jgi:uncharacterized membrane protein
MIGIALEIISDYGFVILGIVGSLIAVFYAYRRRSTSRS